MKRPAILVLGSSGMLGSTVRRVLSSREWLVAGTPSDFDILATPREQWTAQLQGQAYDFVVNCIGILKPAVDELDAQSVARAIRVNALFPHELAAALPGARILHISTDGVFAGDRPQPYLETDPTDCPDVYGKTKALGESAAANVLNFRCSIVGRDPHGGKGLLEKVLRAPEGAELTGFDDHIWNGVTTNQFAALCRRVIESGAFDRLRAVSSVHHFCPNPALTKYELLCTMAAASGRKVMVRRGCSNAPSRRVLGTLYTAIHEIFPGGEDWETLMRNAVESCS